MISLHFYLRGRSDSVSQIVANSVSRVSKSCLCYYSTIETLDGPKCTYAMYVPYLLRSYLLKTPVVG